MTATTTTFNGNVHPAAEMFPMMDAERFSEFVADIKRNGLTDALSLLPDGTLLDGRHRLRACAELGVEPAFEVVDPPDPAEFVVSRNLHRRHLTSAQRAALAAEWAEKHRPEALERQQEGRRKGGKARHGSSVEEVAPSSEPAKTREKAARLFKTNAKYVDNAQRIKRDAPDIFDRIKSGEVGMPEAVAESAKRTGKRAEIRANAAVQRAADFVGRIEGVPGYCAKVSVEAIRSDERLLRHWKEAGKLAIAALRDLLKKLEGS